jgi:hypothetical protein
VAKIFAPSPLVKESSLQKLHRPVSNMQAKRRLWEIQDANYRLNARLVNSRSQYSTKEFLAKSEQEAYLQGNIRRNAGRTHPLHSLPGDVKYVMQVLRRAHSKRRLCSTAARKMEMLDKL